MNRSLLFVVFFLICSCQLSFANPKKEEEPKRTASVKIVVTSTNGRPVPPAETTIKLVRRFTWPRREDYSKSFRNNYAVGIPYGFYSLEVFVLGFAPATRLVYINRSEVYISIGVFFRPFELMERLFTLSGRVTPPPEKNEAMSVRLVCLYADFAAASEVGERGEYAIGDIPYGSYLLLVMKGDKIIDARRFDIGSIKWRDYKGWLDIRLPGTPIE